MINRERIYPGALKYMYRIVMQNEDGNRSFKLFNVLCHMKFRFAVRGAQCIFGQCGPLSSLYMIKNGCTEVHFQDRKNNNKLECM